MKEIVEYTDYRKYIQDYYDERKRNSAFSWQEFARNAGFSSAVFLKYVSEGKKNLSVSAAGSVASAMGLAGFEQTYFVLMVSYAHAKDDKTKRAAFEERCALANAHKMLILGDEEFNYFKSWKNSVIRELAPHMPGAKPLEMARACKQKISAAEVSETLDFLVKAKLLIILTFIVGILTMNSFAGERKSGTYQLIMTSPTSITKIVLGKFLAGIIVILITEVCSCIYLGVISYFGTPDFSNLFTTLLGFLFLTMAYISFGILASSLTEQPIIAYIITFLFFFASMYLSNVSTIFRTISFVDLFSNFTEGIIPIQEAIQLISFTIMCLLLTIISVKRRKNIK